MSSPAPPCDNSLSLEWVGRKSPQGPTGERGLTGGPAFTGVSRRAHPKKQREALPHRNGGRQGLN